MEDSQKKEVAGLLQPNVGVGRNGILFSRDFEPIDSIG